MFDTILGEFSKEEFMSSGHNACAGCGPAIAVRLLMKAVGHKVVIVIPASCWSIISGVVPLRTLETVVMHCPFPSAASTASGVRKGLESLGDFETQVVVLAGDGGTFDIGLQGLSGAAERNEDILFVCYDNEAYMNTGMQKSSATPYGSRSTTTPDPMVKTNPKKDIMKIMAAHRIPYATTATIAFPGDLISKFKRALEIKGLRFLHIFTPCPQGWGSPTDKTVELSRLAVLTRLFPLMEVEDGENYTMNYLPEEYVPIEKYLHLQKRFKSLEKEEVALIQGKVDKEWEKMCKLTAQ